MKSYPVWVLSPCLLGFLALGLLRTSRVFAAAPVKTVVAAPISTSAPVMVLMPKSVVGSATKLRVKNLVTGQQVILDVGSGRESVPLPLDKIASGVNLVPEFSLLVSRPVGSASGGEALRSEQLGSYRLSRSLVFDQKSSWRPIGFRVRKATDGRTVLALDFGIRTKVLTASESERRRSLRESTEVKRLFDTAWKELRARRYDVALELFEKLLKSRDAVRKDQVFQAYLGRGISRFHQLGCAPALEDFVQADLDPKNFDDVSYFRGLCFVESEKWGEAKGSFAELVRKQSPLYLEAARFYLGVVAENQKDFDAAEAAYLDTIDFAEDQSLVGLAKDRLAIVRQLRAEANYETSWFSVLFSGGIGYDSNVVSLPSALAPGDFNITSEASISYLGVLGVQSVIPWSQRFRQALDYNLVLLHYGSPDLSTVYDLQSHDAGLKTDFVWSNTTSLSLRASYNSIFLGSIQTSTEFMAVVTGDLGLSLLQRDADPEWQQVHSLKLSKSTPRAAAASPELDLNAYGVTYSGRHRILKHAPYVFGPGLDVDFRPSTGSNNSLAAVNVLGFWEMPLGPESWKLSLGQEGVLSYNSYYEHTQNRWDVLLKYNAYVSRPIGTSMEARIQSAGVLSFSNLPDLYKYQKASINLLLSAFF